MAWTAKLKSAPERRDGMNHATVVFVSDEPNVAPIEQKFFGDDLNEDRLKMQVAYKLRSLAAHDAAWDTLKGKRADETIQPAEIVDQPLDLVK